MDDFIDLENKRLSEVLFTYLHVWKLKLVDVFKVFEGVQYQVLGLVGFVQAI